MLPTVIPTLYARLAAVAVVIALLGGAYWYVSSLKGKVKMLEQEVLLKDAAIKQQNDAVDALQASAEKRVKDAEKLVAVAKAEAVKARGKATVIYKTRPSDPSNLCKSALDLVNGGAK
jgi:uncharacterized protein (UPF0333 family)